MKDRTITLNTDELVFALHLTSLQSLDTAIDFLKEADSLEDFEETLKDLLKDLSLAVLASNDLIGDEKSLEIAKALLAAHERILGME